METTLAGARRLLIVNDDAGCRQSLTLLLEAAGHVVRSAADGVEALAALGLDRADLIVLDLDMPVMDGWTFRTRQLLDPDLKDIPVVVVSAADGDVQRELQLLGLRDYLATADPDCDSLELMSRLCEAVEARTAVTAAAC